MYDYTLHVTPVETVPFNPTPNPVFRMRHSDCSSCKPFLLFFFFRNSARPRCYFNPDRSMFQATGGQSDFKRSVRRSASASQAP